MRSSKIRDVRTALSKPRIFAIFLIAALSLSIFYANFSNSNESTTISQVLIDSLLNSDKTTENQLDITESTNGLTGKIESSLYNYASDINNGFYSIDSSIGIIVLFDSSIDRNQRQDLLKSMAPHSIIKYNYNLIPAISAIITSAELPEFLQKGQLSSCIQRITENHLQKITSPYLISKNSNEEKWNTAFLTYNWWLDQINATGVNYTGKGIKLAIMDTGISVFPDFFTNGDKSKNRIILSRNFVYEGDSIPYDVPYDQYGHGTHVAGIAGGNGFLSEGKYQGVAPEVNLINARIFNSTNDALEDATIAAIEWCVNESVDIINMSFGSSIPEVWNIENYAIEMAVKQGVIVVAAAGNEGPDFFTGSTPATGMYAISVGATDNKRHMADFSSLGSTFTNQLFPQVAAPGVDIISALSMSSNIGVEKAYLNEFIGGNDYFKYIAISGTSMATPMVCGAIALLLEAFPEATPESIRNALILTANPVERVSGEGYGTSQGAGLINVKGALEYLSRIKSLTGNVNNQSCLYSREIPYSPNDFLKFPGDKQSYNITAYAGMAMTVEVDLPSIDGVSIVSDKTILSFTNHSLQSLSLDIQINYNSTPGLRNAYIKLKDSNSGWIYDSIPIVINITAPKARIYFDSYHGLNDYYPRRVNGFSQIDLYHAMHDLIGYNYALEYNMENWTTGYSAEYNATLLNEEILSRVDVLVLQTPILPYTASEIAAITNFFNNGGSILYLGTKSELVCQKSLNSLFNALKIGIQINPTNVFNWTDYGFSASYNLKMVKDLNRDNNIFDGVNQYFFGYGHTFSISPNARNLSSINGNIVAAAFQNNSQNSTQGRFIGLGDYRVFRSSIYNNAEYYGNHSRLLKNIMDYLSKMDINSPRISISINDRIPSSSNLDLGIEFWDYNLNSNITFFNGTTINATLYTSNNIKSLNISCVGSGMHEISHEFEFFDKSNITIILNLNYSYQSVLYSKNYSFYYYPDLLGYTNFTFSTSLINRSMTNLVNISISNQTTLINSQFYISITTNTALAFRQMDELNKSAEIFNQSVSCSLNSTEIGAAGLGLIYNEEILLVNNQHYLNFFANRYSFSVNNVDPLIDLSKSTFGGLKFSETQSGGYASLISAELGGTYDLEVILNESLLYEEQIANLSVSCSFWPIYVYNGFINFMYPNNIPSNVLSYNAASQAFVTSITIPTSLEWVSGNQTVARSFESDTQNYFALCVISVRDYDGGSDMFYMIFNVWKTIPELDNNTPLLLTFGILAVAVFILNRRPRNVPISNFTSADF